LSAEFQREGGRSLAKISYDPQTDILYIRIIDGKEYDVIETHDSELYVDKSGKVLAIEVWNASKNGLESIIKSLTLKVPPP
jgi:uncharacterized protein YuzE